MQFHPWHNPEMIRWTDFLLSSHQRWTGKNLISRGNRQHDAQNLFYAPYVVVSHGLGADPILNYGNNVALKLWGADWSGFTAMPSRLTAEPVNQAARQEALDETTRRGLIEGYEGIRQTVSGKKFRIHNAVIWNVLNHSGERLGHAALFREWTFL